MAELTTVSFGPQHPVLPEPIHLDLELKDEKVVRAVPSIGYVHRGLEKLVEKRDFKQFIYVAERVCGICSHSHALTYAMCVENTFETGGVGAMHCHPHTQITYIVSGRYRFTIGDETREVGPGDTLLKQNGVMHGCVCLEGGVMLDFFTPMREDFV